MSCIRTLWAGLVHSRVEWVLTAVFLLGIAASPCAAQLCGRMENLGTLLGGSSSSAFGVSADGSVVVGTANNPTSNARAWRWERSTGIRDIGTLGGMRATARSVSSDGLTIVGSSTNPWGYDYASVWITCDNSLSLGSITDPQVGGYSEALGTSGDGSIVVGTTTLDNSGNYGPFRWDAVNGMQEVGLGLHGGEANAVSADGRVIVGGSGAPRRAFRWTSEVGAIDIGTLPGNDGAIARSVSADGSVIVGSATNNLLEQAFRWTESSGMQSLGYLAGTNSSVAIGVSGDGSVVVGSSSAGSSSLAFRWTATSGMQRLGGPGVATRATAVSADGRVVVGVLANRAFRWEAIESAADYDGDYFLQVIDFLSFFDDFGSCQGQPAPCGTNGNPDVNGDTIIDVVDFLDYIDAFALGC